MKDLFIKGVIFVLFILFIFLIVSLLREPYKKMELNNTDNDNTDNDNTDGVESKMRAEMPPSIPKFQFQQDLYPMRYQTLDYAKYKYDTPSPIGYHRYQSNLCDRTQDELPITFPDPNADLPPFEYDPLIMQLKYGSMPCNSCNQLNYCQ